MAIPMTLKEWNLLLLVVGCMLAPIKKCLGQLDSTATKKSAHRSPNDTLLLNNAVFRMNAVEALNQMYDFDFYRAEIQFDYLKYTHPKHPLPYFLFGLSYWWRGMPFASATSYDEKFEAYMDSSIYYAKVLLKKNPEHPEGIFFSAAAYGFKGRLFAERSQYAKATIAGKNAMEYMQKGRRLKDFGAEFLFGDGLYNYYSVYVPENYRFMKPVMRLFPKGNKEEGIKQLELVSTEAYYTRVEAQYYLSRIYANEEKNPEKGYPMMQYLATIFPNNSYFQRQYANMAYRSGHWAEAKLTCQDMLEKIKNYRFGYEANTGRYAAFILAHITKSWDKDENKALALYLQCIDFAKQNNSLDNGYYWYALTSAGEILHKQGKMAEALKLYEEAEDATPRNHPVHKDAQAFLKKYAPKKKRFWLF